MADRAPYGGNNSYGSSRHNNSHNGGHHGHHGRNDGWRERGNQNSHYQGNNDGHHQNRDGYHDRARANHHHPNNGEQNNSNDRRKSHDGAKRSGDYQQNNNRGPDEGQGNNNPIRATEVHDNKRYKTDESQPLYKENVNDLTPEQKEYREKFKKQLLFEDNINRIPLQAFCPRVSEEEKEEAAQYALEKVIEKRAMQRDEEAKRNSKGCYSESSDSDDDYPGASRSKDLFALEKGETQFFKKLKDCLPLTTGFDIEGSIHIKHCYCPCGKDLKKWREEDDDVDMFFDEEYWKGHQSRFEPMGLMQHLEKEGERCILHFGTSKYLEKLYENYNGPGIGHRFLFKMGDAQYKKADAKQTSDLQKVIQVGQRELAKEKEKNHQMELQFKTLDEFSKDLCKQNEMLEGWRNVMQVEKKQKKKFSELDLSSYRMLMASYISSLKATHVKKSLGEICMTVQSSPPLSKTSFSLQDFFDSYYDENPSLKILAEKPSTPRQKKAAAKKAATEVANTRRILFGDDDETGYIAHAMLSTWKMTFKDSADQSKDDTAVDAGGPLRQFKADCWKQLNSLSITVGEKTIRLFEDGEGAVIPFPDNVLIQGGIIPIPDDFLQYHIKLNIGSNKEEVERAIQRAKAYSRAVGRIMFNSFQAFDEHAVPRSTMLPIFANLILRGCIPGDDNYERDDVLKHIVPLAPNPEKNVIKLHIGKKVDEDDDSSELWTPDSIFKQLIPDQFIRSRSLLLGGLEDGLSVGGKQKSSTLEEGSGLAAAFRAIPLEALQKILFGKSTMTLEEVLAVLKPDYCKYEGKWEGTDNELIVQQKEQEQFFEGEFKRYLREEACKNPDLLEEFVQFCTGSNYLPFAAPGEKAFKIIVEFNFTAPLPGSHPLAHTCVNTIRLPGMLMYHHDYDLFRRKMEEALAHCSRFDME